MADSAYLIDTNVLLRWIQPSAHEYSVAMSAVNHLRNTGCLTHYTSQNLGEFWNVLTRPISVNGYGLRPIEADVRLHLLPDTIQAHDEWRKMLVDYAISGVQVHDARLVATMRVHGVRRILTFNTRDFLRFPDVEAIHPGDAATSLLP